MWDKIIKYKGLITLRYAQLRNLNINIFMPSSKFLSWQNWQNKEILKISEKIPSWAGYQSAEFNESINNS